MPLLAVCAEVEAFIALVHFIYHGPVHTPKALGFSNILKMLRLADRFQVPKCTEFCETSLKEFEVSSLEDAVNLLALPEALTGSEVVTPVVRAARTILVDTFGPLMDKSLGLDKERRGEEGERSGEAVEERGEEEVTTGEERERFLKLPEQVFISLLESDELELDSEDSAFKAALLWVKHNTAAGDQREFLRVMGETVLPRIRVAHLSRRTVASIVTMTNSSLSELGLVSPFSSCPEGHPFELDLDEDAEAKCDCLFHREPGASCAGHLGTSYVTACLTLLATADVVQDPNFLASALEGYQQMGPRETRNREPDAIFYFDIPVHVARTSNAGERILKSTVPLGAGK